MHPRLFIVSLLSFTTLTLTLSSQPTIEIRDVASGLIDPTAMLWTPDSSIWVLERAGSIIGVDPNTGVKRKLAVISDLFEPETRGLIGMAIHPNFADSPHVFVYHAAYLQTHDVGWDIWGRVVRYTYDRDLDSLIDPLVILDSLESAQLNFGGGMAILPDRTLLVGVGDGFDSPERAQSHETIRGKILRIGLDGSVPADNPWQANPWPLNLLWATGFRNPTGLDVADDGKIYGTDWGTISLDEINVIEPGGNYGWPLVIGECDGHPLAGEREACVDSVFTQPLYEWNKPTSTPAFPLDLAWVPSRNGEAWGSSMIVPTDADGLYRIALGDDSAELRDVYRYRLRKPHFPDVIYPRLAAVAPDGTVYLISDSDSNRDNVSSRLIRVMKVVDEDPLTRLSVRPVAEGLEVPWEILWGADNWIWLTERPGRIQRLNPETGELRLVLEEEVLTTLNTGLLGMAHHPNFCDSPYVFVALNHRSADLSRIEMAIARYRYDEQNDTLVDRVILVDSILADSEHSGSRLVAARDRTLYVTTGDANRVQLPQDSTSLSGKILRMTFDGGVPADNPSADAEWPAGLVWSIGHRNPQGLAITPDGTMYSSEHGPFTDDEVNIIEPGRNYGWPNVAGLCDQESEKLFCDTVDVSEPVFSWSPTIAPGGIDYYDHPAIPEWQNSLLMSVLKESRLEQLSISDDGHAIVGETVYFAYQYGRLRDVCVAPDGRVFIAVSNRDWQGIPRTNNDNILEISSSRGHPPLPELGFLCDRDTSIVDTTIVDTTVVDTTIVDTTDINSVPFELARASTTVVPHPIRDVGLITLSRWFLPGTVEIYGTRSRLIQQLPWEGGDRYVFHRGKLPAGIYVIRFSDRKGSEVVRLVLE